jgi:hypothetical protein
MTLIVATLSLLVLVFITGSIIAAVTGAGLRPQDHSLILKFKRGAPQVHLGGAKDGPS